MSKYRVLIAGDNLLLNFDGQPRKLGFYVSRIVEAQNHGEAEIAAVDLIREDSRLKGNVLNEDDDPPMLYAEEVEEIKESNALQNVATGFSWYPMDEANNAGPQKQKSS